MDRLVVWVLGTWHACFLLAVFLVGAHAAGVAGSLTGAIGTGVGILAFGWLWIVSIWAAHRVVAGGASGAAVGLYGAGAGVLFVAGAGTVTILVAALQEGAQPLVGLVFVAFACVPAAIVGSLVGWLLMALDTAIVGGEGELSAAPGQQP